MTASPEPVVAPAVLARSPRQLFWRRLRQDRVAFAGGIIVLLTVLMAALAGVIASVVGHGPNEIFDDRLNEFGLPTGPDATFLLGSDNLGRDLLVRIAYGARTSLLVGVLSTVVAVFVGATIGLLSGFFGGVFDAICARVIDIALSLPVILIAMGLASSCGRTKEGCVGGLIKPGLPLVVFILALFGWPYIARIVRSVTLSLRSSEFVEAALSLGATRRWILLREILPNLSTILVVYATLLVPINILLEATLSFLGLGTPPETPSWGQMLSDASGVFELAWWFMLFPGLFLVALTLGFNLLGDGLRDALDPRSQR